MAKRKGGEGAPVGAGERKENSRKRRSVRLVRELLMQQLRKISGMDDEGDMKGRNRRQLKKVRQRIRMNK